MNALTSLRLIKTARTLQSMRPDQIFFYDLETAPPLEFKSVSGATLNPYHGLISEIGVVRGDGETFERKLIERLPRPGVYRNLGSLDIDKYRRDLRNSLNDLIQFCGAKDPMGHQMGMISHNGHNFDDIYLSDNLELAGHTQPHNWLPFDTYRWSQALFSAERKHSLQALAERYSVPYVNAHTALGDSVILMEVYENLMIEAKRRFPGLIDDDLLKRVPR